MSIIQIILALACFGIGFLVAGIDTNSSPIFTVALIAAVLGISLLLRRINNKKDK